MRILLADPTNCDVRRRSVRRPCRGAAQGDPYRYTFPEPISQAGIGSGSAFLTDGCFRGVPKMSHGPAILAGELDSSGKPGRSRREDRKVGTSTARRVEYLGEWFELIGRLGTGARLAIPRLNEFRQNHPNPWVRIWAAEALQRIVPHAQPMADWPLSRDVRSGWRREVRARRTRAGGAIMRLGPANGPGY